MAAGAAEAAGSHSFICDLGTSESIPMPFLSPKLTMIDCFLTTYETL
jgi:hypothetical protein